MIKKILVTLFILILIITICIVSLIVFVNPNNFRGFISDTVKDKTGYELMIEGDLRWHIWPQVSILTDSIKLYDIGAEKPILFADNMRLDVELLPLFSKKLSVKNVLVKSAVINLTNDSKGQVSKNKENNTSNSPSNQTSKPEEQKKSPNWTFTLNKFDVNDSTVVLQQNDDLINFRNINLSVEQDTNNKVSINLKGNIDRNQQDLSYSANAEIDITQFPKNAKITLNKFDFVYKRTSQTIGELYGSINGVFDYQQNPSILKSKDLTFSVNDNIFSGMINVNFDKKISTELQLNSDKIDLTPFITAEKKLNDNVTIQQTKPVVSKNTTNTANELSFLNNFNASAKLKIKQLTANKIILNDINFDIINSEGLAMLNDMSFNFAKGHVLVTGSANGKQKNAQIKLNTKIDHIGLNEFFSKFGVSHDLEGQFNASGNIELNTLTSSKLLENLQGNLAITVTNARLNNINIPDIILNTAKQYTKDIATHENQKKYTEFHKIATNAYLNQGNMEFTTLTANSETIDVIDGSGYVGLIKNDLDVSLNIKMLGGWNGKSETIAKLQQLTIPLRIYGKFTNLHYQIDINKLTKDLFDNKIQQSLDKLRNRLEHQDSKNNSKSKSKQKAIDILGGLLGK